MSVPVVIVTGFLGCGKTSFLRQLLPLCGEAGKRPALIINEVGDVDVDGELLADLHAEQVRLIGGCVCCTLQPQLSETIYDVLDKEIYDMVIIECSGLSNPLDVVNALSAPALLSRIGVSHIVCLVDAARAEKALMSELAQSQVQSADIVIANKIDLLPDDRRTAAESAVNKLAERGQVHWVSFGDVGRDELLKIVNDPAPAHCACGCGHDHHHDHDHHSHGSHSHSLPASFCTVAFNLPESVGRRALEKLMASLPDNVIRAKGFANVDGEGWLVLHKVYDLADIYPLSGRAPTSGAVLVCIGQHLSPSSIGDLVTGTFGL